MNYLSIAKLQHELMFLNFPSAVISHLRDKASLVPESSAAQQAAGFMAKHCPQKVTALWDGQCHQLLCPSVHSPVLSRLRGRDVPSLTTLQPELITTEAQLWDGDLWAKFTARKLFKDCFEEILDDRRRER